MFRTTSVLFTSYLLVGLHADSGSKPVDMVSVSIDASAQTASSPMVRKQTHAEPESAIETTAVQDDAKAETKVQDDAHKDPRPDAAKSSPSTKSEGAGNFPFDSEEEEDIALDELETMTIWNAFSQKHPQDCVMSAWSPKCTKSNCDDCSKTCGGGECTQTRYAIKKKNANGLACPPDLTKDVKCNKDACPTTTTTTAATTTMTTTAGALRMVEFTLMPFFCLWILISQ